MRILCVLVCVLCKDTNKESRSAALDVFVSDVLFTTVAFCIHAEHSFFVLMILLLPVAVDVVVP